MVALVVLQISFLSKGSSSIWYGRSHSPLCGYQEGPFFVTPLRLLVTKFAHTIPSAKL